VMMAKEALPIMINNAAPRIVFADASTVGLMEPIRSQLQSVPEENFYVIGHTGPGWNSAEKLIDAAAEIDPGVVIVSSDSMNIIYSSGTTGVPKGIEHSHFARLAYPCGYGPGLKIDRYTVTVCTTPLYTNGTWITMLPTIYYGGTVVLLPKFSAKAFLDAVQRHKCTHTFMVPTQYIVILESDMIDNYDVSSMKALLTGGQPLPSKTFDQIAEKFPNAGLYETYGMTEGFLTLAIPEDWRRGKRGSVGIPFFGTDLVLLDADKEVRQGELGEVAGYGPALMKGYYKDLQRTEELVWRSPTGRTYIKSGDVGRMDADGYLFIAGRTKDMIKSGGINVFASDIEEVFMRHPEVMEAAAIGIPHEKWGETPLLFAIMRPGTKIDADELMRWGNEKLGKFQRVTRVEFRSEFPRATHDKVLKRALRDPYWAGRERAI
jgi:long-chain acyl-CoA synthetase